MPISYKDIRTDRQWRATTGLDESRFRKLSQEFGKAHEEIFDMPISVRKRNAKGPGKLGSNEAFLFFVLYALKIGPTLDNLGLCFDMDISNAKNSLSEGIRILRAALHKAGVIPRDGFDDAKDFAEAMKGYKDLVIDATEMRTNRPADNEDQKEAYSGKKNVIP